MLLDETPLFDPSVLQELDWNSSKVSFSPPISPLQPGDGLVLRPLRPADLDRGMCSLVHLSIYNRSIYLHVFNACVCVSFLAGLYKVLSQLTHAGDVTKEQFRGTDACLVASLVLSFYTYWSEC